MLNGVSSSPISNSENTGQLPTAPGRIGEEPPQKRAAVLTQGAIEVESEQNSAVVFAWENLPNIQIADQWVPRSVVHIIFSKLPLEELFKVRSVCRLWCQMASQHFTLPRLFPKAQFLNRQIWEQHIDLEKHGLVFEEGKEPPPLTVCEYLEIKRIASEVEHGQGITILTLPKGLNLSKIAAFARAPKMGNLMKRPDFGRAGRKYSYKEIRETITVVVTNGVFKNSRNIGIADHEELVKDLKCEMPQVIPFMAHIILSFISFNSDVPLRLFNNTYTRLSEELDGRRMEGGGFDPDGPSAFLHPWGAKRYAIGVGGMRKFPATPSKHY